jgi:cobalamin biosynthesis protein CobT
VLNTNVLAEDEESKEMKVDSEKYHKQDNLDQQQQQQEQEEAAATEDEEELMLLATAKGDAGAESVAEKAGPSKPVKDTNLLANHKPHKAPEMYAKKFLFSELTGGKTFRKCT